MHNPTKYYIHSLNALKSVLHIAQNFCAEKEIDEAVVLNARLAPDMFDMKRNVQVSCDLAKMMAARLSGTEQPKHEDTEQSFEELYARIDKTIAFMKSIDDNAFEGSMERENVFSFGETAFSGESFLMMFIAPNFYFHMTTAYDILRHNHVPLVKRDFLGAPRKEK